MYCSRLHFIPPNQRQFKSAGEPTGDGLSPSSLLSGLHYCVKFHTWFYFHPKCLIISIDAGRWFVLVLLKVNRQTGTKKIRLSVLLLRGCESKQSWAAEGTFTMSGYFSPQLWINTGRPTIIGCCLWPCLWKVFRHWFKGLWNNGTSLLQPDLNRFQISSLDKTSSPLKVKVQKVNRTSSIPEVLMTMTLNNFAHSADSYTCTSQRATRLQTTP